MNLLILLVVIIIIAVLFGLLYKYKLGGNKDEEEAIDRLCLETGWIRYAPGSKLLCHPDDKILIDKHDKISRFKYNTNFERSSTFLDYDNIIRMTYVPYCLDNYNEYKNNINNIHNIVLLCKFYKEDILHPNIYYIIKGMYIFGTQVGLNYKYKIKDNGDNSVDKRVHYIIIKLSKDNTCTYGDYDIDCNELDIADNANEHLYEPEKKYNSFNDFLIDHKIPLEYFTQQPLKVALSLQQEAAQDEEYEKSKKSEVITDSEDALS